MNFGSLSGQSPAETTGDHCRTAFPAKIREATVEIDRSESLYNP